ncbi:MAG: hypothetical protein DI598_17105 [Pseudopedobacter saltans]|uniref:Antitoxin n=1 Tax=Pseudopedobacter saltans TaxID=151895 RepID=A0A2W5EGY1_9SPHI|nr:MAG: hypothetical protein DI598_17105 [Pseudopedobacter saltans]
MNTKLTLTIEQSVIEKAKKYARRKERSLSDLIENYLKVLTNGELEQENHEKASPKLQALRGSFKMPKDFDHKKELANRLSEKYL